METLQLASSVILLIIFILIVFQLGKNNGLEIGRIRGIKIGKNDYFGKIIGWDQAFIGWKYPISDILKIGTNTVVLIVDGKINEADKNPGIFGISVYSSVLINQDEVPIKIGDIIVKGFDGKIYS